MFFTAIRKRKASNKITDLIGADAYSKFNEYVDSALERSFITAFNNDPATKEKITSDQMEKVVEAMYEARKNNTGTNKVGMVMVSLDPVFEEYSKCTESILPKSQFEEFKTFFNTRKSSTLETAPN